VLDGADFVALRAARSSIVGLSLARPRSIWCRLSADSTFGAAVSAIWSVAGVADKAAERPPARPDTAAWLLGPAGAPANETLAAFQQRAQEVLAAIVLASGKDAAPRAGCGCSALPPARCVELARRRNESLVGDTLPPLDAGERALDSIGFSRKTMASGESALWCFGAELEGGETLWMFLDRRTSQGLGWAYLTAVTRALARAGGSAS
jgi:hypothetical protein